jgi:hypothetical protein
MAEVARPRSRARTFRIKPFQDGALDKERAKLYLVALRSGFAAMWRQQSHGLNFSHLYNMAYKLVIWKQGEQLYDLCASCLRRAAMCTRSSWYHEYAKDVRDITMYSERTYMIAQHRLPLREYAKGLYALRVAQLWRRVRFVAVKGARVTLWRAAFDEVRFRPGGSGWLAARESFHAHSARV